MSAAVWLFPLCAAAILAVMSVAVTFRRLSSSTHQRARGWEGAPSWLRRLRNRNYVVAYTILWVVGTAIGLWLVMAIAFATGRRVSSDFVVEYVIGGALGLVTLEIAWLLYRRLSQ